MGRSGGAEGAQEGRMRAARYFSGMTPKSWLYLSFGVVSSGLQGWMYLRASQGLSCPRFSFLLGPFGLFFLFLALHPDYRGEAARRSDAQHRVVMGLLVASAILAFYNYRFFALR
jgi:hypothetical protein